MSEFNICGVLVHARIEQVSAVTDQLNQLPGTEVHAANDTGRIVVTCEDVDDHQCINTIKEFNNVDGVLSTSLIYQETDLGLPEQELAS